MTHLTLTASQWDDVHDDFKTMPGPNRLMLTWDTETHDYELVHVSLISQIAEAVRDEHL